jgi:hypothetical protein
MADKDPDSVPFCYDAIAHYGPNLLGSDILLTNLGKFGCMGDCNGCPVYNAVVIGGNALDQCTQAALQIARTVRKLRVSALIGLPTTSDRDA